MLRKKRKSPVTIVIGIKCTQPETGITVVCDSRTTDPNGIVHDDAEKLHVIQFSDGNQGIVAEAGNAALASRAIEIITESCKSKPLDDYRALATAAEKAAADIKHSLREQFKGTAEEQQKHFEFYAFELLIAHYYKSKPYIFTLDFALGMATKQDRLFAAIGCGSILADFFISRLDVSQFTTDSGVWTSCYAVQEIKRFDSRCGGKTKIATVKEGDGLSRAAISKEVARKEAEDEAVTFSKEAKDDWISTAEKRMALVDECGEPSQN